MSVLTYVELDYLTGGRRLARIATIGAGGTPHVVPVRWSYDPDQDAIKVGGMSGAQPVISRVQQPIVSRIR
jgi:pyridoxamine 5'-phosphate oxidase family protein